MRKLTHILILMLSTGVFAAAQTKDDLTCPAISVSGPSAVPRPNDSVTYAVSINPPEKYFNLEFLWSASAGEIISGQGTKTIIIKQPDQGVTVTVEVKGLPDNCQNFASEFSCGLLPPQPEKLDEFSGPFSQVNKSGFDNIIEVIQNDPTGQLYILNKFKENTSPKAADKRRMEIKNYLVKSGVGAERMTFVQSPSKTDSVEFWLVPIGATPPTP